MNPSPALRSPTQQRSSNPHRFRSWCCFSHPRGVSESLRSPELSPCSPPNGHNCWVPLEIAKALLWANICGLSCTPQGLGESKWGFPSKEPPCRGLCSPGSSECISSCCHQVTWLNHSTKGFLLVPGCCTGNFTGSLAQAGSAQTAMWHQSRTALQRSSRLCFGAHNLDFQSFTQPAWPGLPAAAL